MADPSVLSGVFADRYSIERELGRGASAIVMLARDIQRGQHVALKILRPELAASLSASRFVREIRLSQKLDHPNVVPVLDSGEQNGLPFFVLPYMDEGSLRDRLYRSRQMTLDEVVAITRSVAAALEHAHARGLIHRDVKPENILFTGGQACLSDFGIAKALESSLTESTTSTSIVRGTPLYMSPEQASGGRDYDGRTDIYSLACVVYEMITAMPPYVGPTPESVIAQKLTHAPRPLHVYRPAIGWQVENVVVRGLHASPADRYQTPAAFADALEEAAKAPPRPRPMQWLSRMSPELRLAAVAVIVLAAAFALWPRSPALKFAERDWILVADFEGPPDDPGLATSVRELATAELNQSRFLNTLPRSQLAATMRLAGIPDTSRVNAKLARELAYRSAVRAVLEGSIRRVPPNSYSVVLSVTDVEDGADIVTAPATATDETLVATVQRLARDVRESLGEHRGTVRATMPLEQVATPSFAAYRKFIDGVALQTRGDGRGSNRLMRDALALDTGFATAWFMMAWNYQNERSLDSARWAFGQALARRDRLSELQRYRLEADVAYTLEYDIPTAIRAYDLYLAAVPRSWVGHNNRGNYVLALGRYEDALQSFDSAVASHPFGAKQAQIQVMNQAATLVALGRVGDAEKAARELRPPFATYVRLMSAAATDDHGPAVDSIATSAATSPSTPAWLRLHATAVAAGSRAARGSIRSADSVLAQGAVVAGTSPDAARWLFRARLLLASAAGREPPALPTALRRDSTLAGAMTLGLAAAARGDRGATEASLARLAKATPVEQRRLGHSVALIRATLEARTGNWTRARELIAGPAWAGEHDASVLDRVGSLTLRTLAAEVYVNSGLVDSAIAVLELAMQPKRMPGNEFAQRGLVTTFAHRQLALWHARAGRPQDAERHWRAFLAAMSRPDAELAGWVREAQRSLGTTRAD